MNKKWYGIYKSTSSVLIEKIEETGDYKKFSNVVEIEDGHSWNGNGDFYMKIFTFGEFKEIVSGNWKVNPLINCSYDWIYEWAKVDVIDVNNKESTFTTKYKKNYEDETGGIRNIFKFIASLKSYSNSEDYLSKH
jgi:hypothetical protein